MSIPSPSIFNASSSPFLNLFLGYLSFALIGLSSWLLVNGLFTQLPVFFRLPGSEKLPSYMSLAIQTSNLCPLLFVLVASRVRLRDDRPPMLAVSLLAVLCGMLLSVLWSVTIADKVAIGVLLGSFVAGAVGSTSVVLYFPFASLFGVHHTSAIATGMGLTSLLASLVSILQQPSSETPLFSTAVYFIILTGLLFISFSALLLVIYTHTHLWKRSFNDSSTSSSPMTTSTSHAASTPQHLSIYCDNENRLTVEANEGSFDPSLDAVDIPPAASILKGKKISDITLVSSSFSPSPSYSSSSSSSSLSTSLQHRFPMESKGPFASRVQLDSFDEGHADDDCSTDQEKGLLSSSPSAFLNDTSLDPSSFKSTFHTSTPPLYAASAPSSSSSPSPSPPIHNPNPHSFPSSSAEDLPVLFYQANDDSAASTSAPDVYSLKLAIEIAHVPLLNQVWINSLYYFLKAVINYAVASYPHSDSLVFWLNAISMLADSLGRFSTSFYRVYSITALSVIHTVFWAFLTLASCMTRTPIGYPWGGWFIIVINCIYVFLYTYEDTVIYQSIPENVVHRNPHLVHQICRIIGICNQIGSFIGALCGFLLVEFVPIFNSP